MQGFVNKIVTLDIEQIICGLRNVKEVAGKAEKVMHLEKKRREYKNQLDEVQKEQERRETVKWVTMDKKFKKTGKPLQIPSPPSSQEGEIKQLTLDVEK